MTGRQEMQQKQWTYVNKLIVGTPSYVQEWKSYMQAKDLSPKTVMDYVNTVKKYLRTINCDIMSVKIDNLTVQTVWDFMNNLKYVIDKDGNKKEASRSQLNKSWSTLNNFFKFMKRSGYKAENIMDNTDRPGGTDEDELRERRVLLNEDDFQEILSTIEVGWYGSGSEYQEKINKQTKYRDLSIMSIFMCTGVRISALISLDLGDLDLDNESITFYDKGRGKGKFHKYKLSDNCVEYLGRWIYVDRPKLVHEKGVDTNALFLGRKDGHRINRDAVVTLVKRSTESALGAPLSPHKLRAGVCSILYEKTGDIEFVKRYIGHNSTQTTARYVVTKGKEIERGYEILNDIV